jgi:hypothetical protein
LHTVIKWRRRFLLRRLDGLHDAPRSGTGERASAAEIAAVIRKSIAGRPTSRSLARRVGRSQGTIARLWAEFGARPGQNHALQLALHPDFVRGVDGIAGVNTCDSNLIFALRFGRSAAATKPAPGTPRRPPWTIDRPENYSLVRFMQAMDRAHDSLQVYVFVFPETLTRHGSTVRWLRTHPRFIVHVVSTERAWHHLLQLWFERFEPRGRRMVTGF